jgi:hypothetical protein
MMKPAEFARFIERDGGCAHCGRLDDTLVPGHRLGRGHGGSRLRDVPSNIVAMCSWFNGIIEHDEDAKAEARRLGLSLIGGQSPLSEPVWNFSRQRWERLDDEFHVTPLLLQPDPGRIW